MTSALFLFALLLGSALFGISGWKLLGILSKRQAFFAFAVLLAAGLAGLSWEYAHFVAGAILLLFGSILTTVYLEKATQKA